MLSRYREIPDRIFELCRVHGVRPDFPETTKNGRQLLVPSQDQRVLARAFVPTYADPGPLVLDRLQHDLAGISGEGWME